MTNFEDESGSNLESSRKNLFDDSDSDDHENERQVIGGVIKGKTGGKRGKVIHPQKEPRNQQQQQRRRQQPNDNSSSRVPVQSLYHSIFTNFPRHINQPLEEPSKSILEKLKKMPIIRNAIADNTKLNVVLDAKSTHINQDNQFFELSAGEDGLSSQSTYENSIEDPSYNSSICPFQIFLRKDLITDDNVLALIYSKLAAALTDLRAKITSKSTLSFAPSSGKTINTHIIEYHPMNVVLKDIDDIEFIDWCHSNNFAQLWFCQDVQSCPILVQAIIKAIRKSPSRESAGMLFQDKSKNRRNQFLGFVSSHKSKTGVLVSFHIHSCAVFHALGRCTIVSCLLTTRHHILSNMQDRILQLVQLVQYRSNESFSLSITNEHVGYNVLLDTHSKNCYKTLGFDTSFRNDDSQHFIITTELPIPFHSHGNTYSWAKYGHHILPPSVSLSGLTNVEIDVTYRQCLLEFLCIDLASFHLYNFTEDHQKIFDGYFLELMSDVVEEGTGSYLQDSSFEDLLCSEKDTICSRYKKHGL